MVNLIRVLDPVVKLTVDRLLVITRNDGDGIKVKEVWICKYAGSSDTRFSIRFLSPHKRVGILNAGAWGFSKDELRELANQIIQVLDDEEEETQSNH